MPAKPKTAEPRHRLLIVDDDESTRLLLARLLTKDMKVEAQLALAEARLRRDAAERGRQPGHQL